MDLCPIVRCVFRSAIHILHIFMCALHIRAHFRILCDYRMMGICINYYLADDVCMWIKCPRKPSDVHRSPVYSFAFCAIRFRTCALLRRPRKDSRALRRQCYRGHSLSCRAIRWPFAWRVPVRRMHILWGQTRPASRVDCVCAFDKQAFYESWQNVRTGFSESSTRPYGMDWTVIRLGRFATGRRLQFTVQNDAEIICVVRLIRMAFDCCTNVFRTLCTRAMEVFINSPTCLKV